MEEITQKANGGSENKILLGVLAFLVMVAAAGYQYNMAGAPTQRELEIQRGKMLRGESLGGARTKVEGVDQDKHGFTSMHRAAEKGVDAVRALLPDQRKALNVTDDWNESPLTKAARKGLHSTVALLLKEGSDPNIISTQKRTALYHALFGDHGNETAVELINGGADVNVSLTDGQTLLHFACKKGNDDAARLLLAHKIDVHQVNDDGQTALHLATAHKDESKAVILVKLLLDSKASPNVKDRDTGRAPLHDAVSAGHALVIQALLNGGADLTITESMFAQTPLAMAKKKKKHECAKMLEKHQSPKA